MMRQAVCLLLPSLLIMFIPSTFKRPVSSWKALNLRKTLLIFFNDTATTEIYTLSLHDALPICPTGGAEFGFGTRFRNPAPQDAIGLGVELRFLRVVGDRKCTRLNSSNLVTSYAVFSLKTWKALNLRNTLLMTSSVRLKPLNCSRLPCVYAQETLTFLLTQKKTCVKNYVQKE